MSDHILEIKNIRKKFCRSLKRSLVYGGVDIVRELALMPQSNHLRRGEFWAVDNVSLSLKRGESLGLIGSNGSGKTTLLRMVAGILKPTHGSITTRGRIAPLLALGAGFDPVLTGRENVFNNLALLGFPQREAKRLYEPVVAFSELEASALEAPIRTYSSGMAARLGFACAVFTSPDLIIVDEVLAVGDVQFRMKCYQLLSELQKKGTSIVMVSHNTNTILSMSQVCLYLNHGVPTFFGPSAKAMQLYLEDLAQKNPNDPIFSQVKGTPNDRAYIEEVGFLNAAGKKVSEVSSGQPFSLIVTIKKQRAVAPLSLTLIVRDKNGGESTVLYIDSKQDGYVLADTAEGSSRVHLNLPRLGLRAGTYTMKVQLVEGDYYSVLDMVENFEFKVAGDHRIGVSLFNQAREWQTV